MHVHLYLQFYSTCVLSRDLAVLQSIADLAGEIAALEQEVIRKELHLLSLYRRAFDQHLSDSCGVSEVNNSGYMSTFQSCQQYEVQCAKINAICRWIKRQLEISMRVRSV